MASVERTAETMLYAERDIVEQGEHYCRHVNAMTAEGLHAKSDIAAELAHRDIEIELNRWKLRRIVEWLEANQPDVFSRGLWEAIK